MSFPTQIPPSVDKTVNGYIGHLKEKIDLANKQWDHFGKASSYAYKKAYDHIDGILQGIERLKQQRTAADQAAMAFMLSILTVGVAGGAASAIFGVAKGVGVDVGKDIVKQIIKSTGGYASDAAVKALSPEKAGNAVFAPSDVTPLDYLENMLEGVSYRTAVLASILDAVQWDTNTNQVKLPRDDGYTESVYIVRGADGRLNVSSAKLLTETFLNSSYYQQMPSADLSSGDLYPKACLALWIGWALNRDANYWSDGDQIFTIKKPLPFGGGAITYPSDATMEQPDWSAVRDDLATNLKVPPGLITSQLASTDMRGNVVTLGLYMWGFMSWASSSAALNLLLDNSVRSSDAFAVQTAYRGASRKILSPKDVHNPHWIKVPDPVVTHIDE